jgi:hypothetical protein
MKSPPRRRNSVAFLESLQDREDVVISELILLELYCLLRNPAVPAKPLSASIHSNL